MENIFFIFLLLLMMEVLPSSARITTASRLKKRTQTLCVGGKWFQVGSFRFWQRSTCGKRRQGAMVQPWVKPITTPGDKVMPKLGPKPVVTKEPTTLDLELIMPSKEVGPKRNDSYDPNFGHEPYWAEGDWVFDKAPYNKNTTTHMCGIRCPQVFSEFGVICGRNKHFKYATFNNYCQLKNKDCGGRERWMMLYKDWTMVYKGKCSNAFVSYEPDDVDKRAKLFIKDFHT